MMVFSKLVRLLLRWAGQRSHTWPDRLILVGLGVASCYIAIRLGSMAMWTLRGAASSLMGIAIGLGLYELWRQRRSLSVLQAEEDDRLLGSLLIISGIGLFPFCWFAVWAQAIVCLVILAGIACSLWGSRFFSKYPMPPFLIALGLIPQTTLISREIWEALTPPLFLERGMAWAGSLGLQSIGQTATAQEQFIVLPAGSVEVAWGCNGFYMAATMAIASLLLGLFLGQNGRMIGLLIAIGIVLALLSNIPRLILVTFAAVYWGEWWFDFWHGSWGGQIFVTVMFTVYYYAVMAIVKPQSTQTH